MGMNYIVVSGNLVHDAKVIDTRNGKMAKVRVANNMGFGENVKVTYYDILIFGKRAESKLPHLLKKGTKVVVTGEHSFSVREHEEQKYYDNNIRMAEIEILPRDAGTYNPQTEPVNAKPLPQVSHAVDVVDVDDDIPF